MTGALTTRACGEGCSDIGFLFLNVHLLEKFLFFEELSALGLSLVKLVLAVILD